MTEQSIQTCSICSVALTDNKSTLSFGVGIGGVGRAAICCGCEAVARRHMGKMQEEVCEMVRAYKRWDES